VPINAINENKEKEGVVYPNPLFLAIDMLASQMA